MKNHVIKINDKEINVYSLNTVIVGTGAAGFNAADSLYSLGQKDIAIVTEGLNMGTSRNTGSDKQTYYKLTLEGDTQDSVVEMAETLFKGGCMHGDIALVEAALSAKCFYKLADIGVPFPHNRYGEYVGYKTDHDPRKRATSAGPLTSKFMTEKLEQQVKNKGIKIFDGYQVIGILTCIEESTGIKKAVGLITLNLDELEKPNMGITLFNCTNIVYATGGPAGMYLTSVYPESQTGASGIAFEAGVRGINLTESQYGIASTKFRWNLSGTYQQVIPRYVSTDKDGGDEREFLDEYFETPGKMLDAIFLKGYQWPFDPRKAKNQGSSLIDILVYNEIQNKNRRVFLDFKKNPAWGSKVKELDFSLFGEEAHTYLKNSGALFGMPIDRLAKMNRPAIDLYKNNGIDLYNEYLEIAVSAQHNNGGLMGNIWWESNIRHLFPVGEVNGTFGVYRPGGTALNSSQVGSLRAAQYINTNYTQQPIDSSEFVETVYQQVCDKINIAARLINNKSQYTNILNNRDSMQSRMSKLGSHIRSLNSCTEGINGVLQDIKKFTQNTTISSARDIPEVFKNRDILITQFVYLNAIKEYMQKGGKSRGSYLIQDSKGGLPVDDLADEFKFLVDDGELMDTACEIELIQDEKELRCITQWNPVRPIPFEDSWFENVWSDYRKGEIIK